MINIELKAAKRASEIIQEKDQALNNLNLSAALKQTAREFSERKDEHGLFVYDSIK